MSAEASSGDRSSARPGWVPVILVLPSLLAFVLTVCRAATLSLTFDEAISYTQFVRPSIQSLFIYSTNNHILNSWLMKVTTGLFGSSELALRLPAVAGAGLYLLSMFRLSERLFPRWPERLVVVALLSWNPLLLDFFCLARGYSLALGFLALALLFVTRELQSEFGGFRNLIIASVALALSICSNWSFLFVEGGLVVGFLFARALQRRGSGSGLRSWWKTVGALTFPGAVVGAAVIGPYAGRMAREWSFVGFSTTPADSVRDLMNAIFFRAETALRTAGDLKERSILLLPHNPWQQQTMEFGAPLVVGAAVLLLAALLVFSVPLLTGRDGQGARLPGQLAWLIGFALTINWAAYDAGHYERGLSFPLDRVCIYLVPLFALLVSCLAFGMSGPWIRALSLFMGLLILALNLKQDDPRYVRSWAYNAQARSFFQILRARHAETPGVHFRLGGPWPYATVFEYYRQASDATWLSAYETVSEPGAAPYDFFVYHPNDVRPALMKNYYDVAEDPVSGARLAERITR